MIAPDVRGTYFESEQMNSEGGGAYLRFSASQVDVS